MFTLFHFRYKEIITTAGLIGKVPGVKEKMEGFAINRAKVWRTIFLGKRRTNNEAGMIAHPVTQVIGKQALVDILDLSEVAWTYWGCFYTQQ